MFGRDYDAGGFTNSSARVVTHGCCKVERRDSKGCSRFDDATRIDCTAELIAEFCLVTVKRNQLVAQKALNLRTSRWRRLLGPMRMVISDGSFLLLAAIVQGSQQLFQR